MRCNIGDGLPAHQTGPYLQVVDVEVVVVGGRIVGAEGYVSARAGVGGKRNLLEAPRGGGVNGVDGNEAAGVFGIVHYADFDVARIVVVAAEPEVERELVDVDGVDTRHHGYGVDVARRVGAHTQSTTAPAGSIGVSAWRVVVGRRSSPSGGNVVAVALKTLTDIEHNCIACKGRRTYAALLAVRTATVGVEAQLVGRARIKPR